MFIRKIEKEEAERLAGKDKDNRSFLSKYVRSPNLSWLIFNWTTSFWIFYDIYELMQFFYHYLTPSPSYFVLSNMLTPLIILLKVQPFVYPLTIPSYLSSLNHQYAWPFISSFRYSYIQSKFVSRYLLDFNFYFSFLFSFSLSLRCYLFIWIVWFLKNLRCIIWYLQWMYILPAVFIMMLAGQQEPQEGQSWIQQEIWWLGISYPIQYR